MHKVKTNLRLHTDLAMNHEPDQTWDQNRSNGSSSWTDQDRVKLCDTLLN